MSRRERLAAFDRVKTWSERRAFAACVWGLAVTCAVYDTSAVTVIAAAVAMSVYCLTWWKLDKHGSDLERQIEDT